MLPFLLPTAGPKPRGVAMRAYSENVRQALESKKMWEMNEELAAMVRRDAPPAGERFRWIRDVTLK